MESTISKSFRTSCDENRVPMAWKMKCTITISFLFFILHFIVKVDAKVRVLTGVWTLESYVHVEMKVLRPFCTFSLALVTSSKADDSIRSYKIDLKDHDDNPFSMRSCSANFNTAESNRINKTHSFEREDRRMKE